MVFCEIPSLGNVSIVSAYLSPSGSIEDQLKDLESFDFACGPLALIGDFNCASKNWGYRQASTRGDKFLDFILKNNLTLANSFDGLPTFQSRTKRDGQYLSGNPDLTLLNPHLNNFIQNWRVLDVESLSDHRLVSFELAFDFEDPIDESFIFKTFYSAKSVLHEISIFKYQILKLIDETTDAEGVDYFYSFFMSIIERGLKKTKKRKKRKTSIGGVSWRLELSSMRNYLTALRRRIRRLELAGAVDTLHVSELETMLSRYRRDRAVFRKLIKRAKVDFYKSWIVRNCWGPWGHCQKYMFEKTSNYNHLVFEIPDLAHPTEGDRINCLLDYSFGTKKVKDTNDDALPLTSEYINEPITMEELSFLLRQCKKGKAPGPDSIDHSL